jgi:hypothetical protein
MRKWTGFKGRDEKESKDKDKNKNFWTGLTGLTGLKDKGEGKPDGIDGVRMEEKEKD